MITNFKTRKGIEIFGQVSLISGTEIPGNSTDTNDAQVGSMYLRTNGIAYSKISSGSGTNTWSVIKITSLPYDIAFYIPEPPIVANTIISGFLSPRIMSITAGSLNIAKCVTASTVEMIFQIKLNGVVVITVTFPANSTTGNIVFSSGSVINILAGDNITLSTTSTLNDFITGVGITFVCVSLIS